MNETRLVADVDIAEVIRALSAVGATTVPGLLGDETRRRLLQEARTFAFIAAPATVKPYGVQQRYAATAFPPGSGFQCLRDAFRALLADRLARLPAYPFATPLRFNSSALHRYPPGRLGISPHRDSARSINLIAIFVLEGKGRFFICRDRNGRDAVDLPNAPGDLPNKGVCQLESVLRWPSQATQRVLEEWTHFFGRAVERNARAAGDLRACRSVASALRWQRVLVQSNTGDWLQTSFAVLGVLVPKVAHAKAATETART